MTLPKARSMFDNTKSISSKQTPRNPMPSYFTLCTKVDICFLFFLCAPSLLQKIHLQL